MHARFVSALLVLAATSAGAQTIAQLGLSRALARSAEGFTDIVGARELPDGRVVAVDLRERRIALLDFARGTVRNVSREGQGPRDYTGAFTIIPWLGDSLLVYGRRDFLKIAPTGEAVSRFALDVAVTRQPGPLGAPRYADRAGHIYFDRAEPLKQAPNGRFIASVNGTVLRWNVHTNAVDSIGAFQYRDPKQPLVTFWRPFPAHDATAVLPDGRVVFVRAGDYRVEIWRDGARVVQGPRIPYTPLPVGAAERDAFRDDAVRRPRGSAIAAGPGGQPLRGQDREAARRAINVPDDAFPPTMPAIVDERATLVDPAGRIWIARSFPASSTDRLFDVVDDRGELVARVTLKNRGRVVGFGESSVYVVTPDEDDVEWLERYAMPSLPGR